MSNKKIKDKKVTALNNEDLEDYAPTSRVRHHKGINSPPFKALTKKSISGSQSFLSIKEPQFETIRMNQLAVESHGILANSGGQIEP